MREWLRRWRFVLVGVYSLGMLVLGLSPPMTSPKGWYVAVTDPATKWHDAKDRRGTVYHWPTWHWPADHIVDDGRLYLLVQTEWHPANLIDAVDHPHWSAEAIAAFRQRHPDLEQYWPAPEQPDGGVCWAASTAPKVKAP